MPRSTGLVAGLLLPFIAVAALSGCSSSDNGSAADAAATASGSTGGDAGAATPSASSSAVSGHGRLDYHGSANGAIDITMSVACATVGGKLTAVTAPAPDSKESTTPSFVATIGSDGMATLVTKDKKTFVKAGAKGLSAKKYGEQWVVMVGGTKLGAADASGGSVTVNGTLSCTKVSGT